MAERHDTVALAWVKGAIADCLAQARLALEHFCAEPGDEEDLVGFIENLHQVRGCLVMLELSGAALLAEELKQLGVALREKRVTQRGEALGALFRGLEQLPLYLDRLRSARRDLPLVVLPVLNQLRAERGVEPLGQGSLTVQRQWRRRNWPISTCRWVLCASDCRRVPTAMPCARWWQRCAKT